MAILYAVLFVTIRPAVTFLLPQEAPVKKIARHLALATVCLLTSAFFSTAASAADLCFNDEYGEHFIFYKVPALVKGKAISLYGISWYSGNDIHSINGAAYLTADGTTIYTSGHGIGWLNSSVSYTFSLTSSSGGLKKLNGGTGVYENSGDATTDGALTLTLVDCKTITRP